MSVGGGVVGWDRNAMTGDTALRNETPNRTSTASTSGNGMSDSVL